jgi:uncharacterized protein
MIAFDTNILVYSVREDSPRHKSALAVVRAAAEASARWAIPWPCVHEFVSIVTHPRIYKPPTPLRSALLQVDYWMESPSLRLLGEPAGYWDHLKSCLNTSRASGPMVHDAHVAAICRAAGVTEIWTADRDFSRFPGVPTRNPLDGRD